MRVWWICVLLCVAAAGCRTTAPDRTSGLEHVVLLWLKDPGNAVHRQQIMDVSKTFAEIPAVRSVRVGEVVPSDRAIVDSSFDVGLIVRVDDVQGLNDYLGHPLHEQAKNDVLLPLVEKILVYDFSE